MFNQQDTIAAIITAQGIGAVGAIRISGPDAFDIAQQVFHSKNRKKVQEMDSYSLAYGLIYHKATVLDQALLLKMKGPSSFTGEDVIELQCHGGPLVLAHLLQVLVDNGARVAAPGEFSQRAFLNGKIDLSQAEAIMDLVSASNNVIAEASVNQMQGSLTSKIQEMKVKLIGWIAAIEADIDFPDEEIEPIDRDQLLKDVKILQKQVNELLETASFGRIYREGLRLVFYGRPNVGKSSLLNALLKQKRAIVTAEAGTTRDILEERFMLKGIPIILMDTAGVRETDNLAEVEGVNRAKVAAQLSDLVLFVLDISKGLTIEDKLLLEDLDPKKTLILANKSDLIKQLDDNTFKELTGWEYYVLSAFDHNGIDELIEKINNRFAEGNLVAKNTEVLINQRHENALIQVKRDLEGILESLTKGVPSDFISIDLQSIWSALGEITGETVKEAMITEIFSRFCLGK